MEMQPSGVSSRGPSAEKSPLMTLGATSPKAMSKRLAAVFGTGGRLGGESLSERSLLMVLQ